MPGTPSSASISKPESSARANIPEALAYARAFNCAFSAKVVPVSSTSISNCTSHKERSRKGMSEKMVRYSSSLCILVVASNKSRILSLYRGKLLCKEKLHFITTYPLARPEPPNRDTPTSTAKHCAGMYIIINFPMLSRLIHKMGYRLQPLRPNQRNYNNQRTSEQVAIQRCEYTRESSLCVYLCTPVSMDAM